MFKKLGNNMRRVLAAATLGCATMFAAVPGSCDYTVELGDPREPAVQEDPGEEIWVFWWETFEYGYEY